MKFDDYTKIVAVVSDKGGVVGHLYLGFTITMVKTIVFVSIIIIIRLHHYQW